MDQPETTSPPPPPAPATPPPPSPSPRDQAAPAGDAERNKALAALSYVWVVSLVMLLLKKDSAFIQFHARQGLVLFLAFTIFGFIPFFGWIANIAVVALAVTGFISAVSGRWMKLPVVFALSQKVTF